MNANKPVASLSLDLDNKWSYMKTHGEPGWQSFPSYLDIFVPRVLEFLDKRNLKITFFVVGQDAALEKNHAALRAIADAGHEIGSHSYNHEQWLQSYSEEAVETDLNEAEIHIKLATGQRPIGFRGPGFSLSPTILKVLARRGYKYDASTFPTFIGPLARAYYFRSAHLTEEEKEKHKKLYGTLSDGLRPNRPYSWNLKEGHLIEIPVTTMPLFRLPIHITYLQYLGRMSPGLAALYFKISLQLCRFARVSPSLLLHPLDFLDAHDAPEVTFIPGMDLSLKDKLEIVGSAVDMLSEQYAVCAMREHAEAVEKSRRNLPSILPDFDSVRSY